MHTNQQRCTRYVLPASNEVRTTYLTNDLKINSVSEEHNKLKIQNNTEQFIVFFDYVLNIPGKNKDLQLFYYLNNEDYYGYY